MDKKECIKRIEESCIPLPKFWDKYRLDSYYQYLIEMFWCNEIPYPEIKIENGEYYHAGERIVAIPYEKAIELYDYLVRKGFTTEEIRECGGIQCGDECVVKSYDRLIKMVEKYFQNPITT